MNTKNVLQFLLLSCMFCGLAQAEPFAYIPNYNDGTVSVIDCASDTVVHTFEVGGRPASVAVHPNGLFVYIGNRDDYISIYSTVTQEVITTVPVCDVVEMVIHPDGSPIFMTGDCTWNYSGQKYNCVQMFSTVTNSQNMECGISHSTGWDGRSRGVALDPNGEKIYIGLPYRKGVVATDADTAGLDRFIEIGEVPGGLAVSPDNIWVYTLLKDADTYSAISVDDWVVYIDGHASVDNPRAITLSPDGDFLFIANYDSNDLFFLELFVGSEFINVGQGPVGVDVHPMGGKVYVVNSGSDSVSVIDVASRQVIKTIAVGDKPTVSGHFISAQVGLYSSPESLDFGDIDHGSQSGTQTVSIQNVGTGSLQLGAILLAGEEPDSFEKMTDSCSNQALTSQASCSLGFRFKPSSPGAKTAQASVATNDPNTPLLQVQLSGNGLGPDLYFVGAPDPISNYLIMFGSTPVDGMSYKDQTIVNTGNQDLTLGILDSQGGLALPFALANDTCSEATLAPQEQCTFRLGFMPTAVTSYSDSFNITSNDPDEDSFLINLSGSGTSQPIGSLAVFDSIDPGNDSQLPFGSLTVGEQGQATVSLFNMGNAGALTVTNVSIAAEGQSIDSFFYDLGDGQNDTCGALPITVPGPWNLAQPPHLQPRPCTIDIAFIPPAIGDKEAVLLIESNDPNNPHRAVCP
jgi:YVTN family beta-propeller protein